MERVATRSEPSHAWIRDWPQVLLGCAVALLIAQLVSALSGLSIASLPATILWMIDVRNWHWTWQARASLLSGLQGAIGAADVRAWSWTTFAGLSVTVLVTTMAVKAWRDRKYS